MESWLHVFLVLVLVLVAVPSQGQVIEVRDEAGNPVPAAVIRNESGTARMTDLNGRLELDSLIRQGDTLEIRSMGFGTQNVAMPIPSLDMSIEMSSESVNLSEVVVSAVQPARESMSAVSVSRISAKAIAREVPSNAATLLWNTGQVMVQQSQQGGGSPVLRGFEANRILLVVDGVRLNNAIYRSGHLQNALTVDPFVMSSAEVRHGAASVQFGSDALGGVIHYRTRSPGWEDGSLARGQMSFSSVSRTPTIHADAEVTRGRFASLTSVTHRRFGDLKMGSWRPHGEESWGRIPWRIRTEYVGTDAVDYADVNDDENAQPNTGYVQTDVVQKFRFGRVDRHVELNVQHSISGNVPRFDRLNDVTLDGGPKWAEWDYGPQKRTLAALRFRSKVRGLGNVTLTTAYQDIEESRLKARFGASNREVQLEKVDVVSVQLDVDQNLGPWKVAYGGSWDHNRVRSTAWTERRADGIRLLDNVLTRYPNGGAITGSLAAYGGVARAWNRLKWEGAARYSRGWLDARFEDQPGLTLPFTSVGYNRGALTGSSTLRWHSRSRWGIHTVLASAFRNPNVDDVGKIRAKDGLALMPTDGLLPERMYSAEIGGHWRTRNGRFQSNASAFSTALVDAIQPRDSVLTLSDGSLQETLIVEGDTNAIQLNANIGRANIRGLQFKAVYAPSKAWRMWATLNVTHGANAEGAPLSHIPPVFGLASIRRSWEWFTLEGQWRWSGKKQRADYGPGTTDNAAEATPMGTPAWSTLGLDMEARITERSTLNIGLHNVLDRHYKVFASGISAPGRDVRIGWRWNPNG